MKNGKHRTVAPPRPSVELVSRALNQAAQDAVELHRKADQRIAVWHDGRVVLIPPPTGRTAAKSKKSNK